MPFNEGQRNLNVARYKYIRTKIQLRIPRHYTAFLIVLSWIIVIHPRDGSTQNNNQNGPALRVAPFHLLTNFGPSIKTGFSYWHGRIGLVYEVGIQSNILRNDPRKHNWHYQKHWLQVRYTFHNEGIRGFLIGEYLYIPESYDKLNGRYRDESLAYDYDFAHFEKRVQAFSIGYGVEIPAERRVSFEFGIVGGVRNRHIQVQAKNVTVGSYGLAEVIFFQPYKHESIGTEWTVQLGMHAVVQYYLFR